jgi:hypothetical protein
MNEIRKALPSVGSYLAESNIFFDEGGGNRSGERTAQDCSP